MRLLIRLASRLYPAQWRQRYGAEFEALLEDVRPTWIHVIDIGWSAIRMNMNIRNLAKFAITFGIIGTVLAARIASRIPDKYISEGVLQLSGDKQGIASWNGRLVQRVLSQRALGELIRKNGLYRTDLQHMPLEDVVERMRRDIAISAAKGTADAKNLAVFVRFAHRDPAIAQLTTNELISKIVDANQQASAEAASSNNRAAPGAMLELRSGADLPSAPAWPNRLVIIALGGVTGALIVFVAAGVMRLRSLVAQT